MMKDILKSNEKKIQTRSFLKILKYRKKMLFMRISSSKLNSHLIKDAWVKKGCMKKTLSKIRFSKKMIGSSI